MSYMSNKVANKLCLNQQNIEGYVGINMLFSTTILDGWHPLFLWLGLGCILCVLYGKIEQYGFKEERKTKIWN